MVRRNKPLERQLEKLWQAVESGSIGGPGTPGPKGDKGDKGDPGEPGPPGNDGAPGADGQSGAQGVPGERGEAGPKGDTGNDGNDGADGAPGQDGPSAYEVAVANGFQGNEAQWLASLVGAKGDKGDRGDAGLTGQAGADGAAGSDGNDGAPGDSAYQVAVNQGFGGNVAAWLASLVGPKGDKGDTGSQGNQGAQGNAGADGKTVLSGSGAPGAGLGVNGDFYIRTDTNAVYGPKAAGAWGSPTSLVGPQGQQGIQGPAGADGVRTATTAFGYSAGTGGTVTQATNKSTAVTLNKLTGEITMNAAALAAAAVVTFTLNNSTAAVGDHILVSHVSGGTVGPYLLNGRVTGAGVISISVRNTSAGSLSEAIVLKVTVVKAVTA